MRLAWLSLLVGSVALAAPPKPVRKPAPPDLDAKALANWVEAIIYDKKGDYDAAISRYQSVGKDMPAVMYNIADLQRRAEEWDRAIEAYKKYLELAPNASDKAAVEKLIEQIQKTPQVIVVDGEDLDAVVFVNGKAMGPSPVVTSLPDGEHVVDRIGPASFESERVYAKPMQNRHINAASYREEAGNVVMSSSSPYTGSWNDGDKQFQMHHRFKLPPGRVDTYYFSPGRACSPISFEVPADGVVYVWVDAPKDNPRGGCIPIKVTAQKIQFPKGSK